ncbi:translation elongation factor Ts [Henriciella litoralis]|uniref:translation elongation factor Ts n=1 Tax=Henriciella litoralis TaxID=568102 RepID=UPI000A039A73|nr:translation elongation factor Ts [Henriciella litoralis]
MAQITAALVKDLRDRTGAGMMDAKKALVENDGDTEAAIDWLRAKGLSKAAKKSGRTAADGLVAAVRSDDGKTGALVELNAETDFVARNEKFQSALREIAAEALKTDGSLEALQNAPAPSGEGSVTDMITALVATVGENMTLRRTAKLSAPNGQVASYIHSAEAPDMGKIGVLVALEGADAEKLADAGRKVAMHVAATSPASATTDDLDPELVERERQVLTDQARESGKPDNVIEKMIEGRIKKFYKEVVLVEQPFVMNPDQTVGQFIEEQGATLVGFVRFTLGEGIEKDADDFAAEVASMTSKS